MSSNKAFYNSEVLVSSRIAEVCISFFCFTVIGDISFVGLLTFYNRQTDRQTEKKHTHTHTHLFLISIFWQKLYP